MADQYTVELGFNRPPEDIRRMAKSVRVTGQVNLDEQFKTDMLYTADVMDEIANKMEEQGG